MDTYTVIICIFYCGIGCIILGMVGLMYSILREKKEKPKMQKIKRPGFFQEDSGSFSMMRLIHFLIVMTIMIPWGVISIIKQEMQSLDPTLLTLIITISGIKVGQKYFEGKNGNDNLMKKILEILNVEKKDKKDEILEGV